MKQKKIFALLISLLLFTTGCSITESDFEGLKYLTQFFDYPCVMTQCSETENAQDIGVDNAVRDTQSEAAECKTIYQNVFTNIAEYSDNPYSTINDNKPFFAYEDITDTAYIALSELDHLGRTGVAYACLGPELVPTGERGAIGQIRPSGWHTVKYPGIVDGNYLYNRCHQIAFCLSGLNADERNLMTGTRYFNNEGMLPFEVDTVRYIEKTGNHVLYRVTPDFRGDNLLANGALMEAYSVEDNGKGLCFCVYVYNVQPGIKIDYATGDSREQEE